MNENPPVFSAGFCRNKGLCILRIEGNTAVIGYIKRISYEDEQRIERYCSRSGYKTEYESCTQEELKIRIARLYSGSAELKTSEAEKNEEISDAARAAPAVNLLNSILAEGIMKDATDIHIFQNREGSLVRYRKDGRLYRMFETANTSTSAVIARIKLLSGLNILEHRRCQDGRFEYKDGENEYEIRVSVMGGSEGESASLRILGINTKVPPLEELGFTAKECALIRKMTGEGSGLILVTGPTGSGKTTTLASIICELNKEDVQIITIEDPVEYRIKDVLQVNVEEETGKTFSELLKRALRHDPDILLVGEIRDEESARIACRMALTGHLVLASIHTDGWKETPLRLTDMRVPPYMVSAVLKGVISQRLIPKEGGGRSLKAEIKVFEKSEEVRKLCMI